MTGITILTSGSTKLPKKIKHDWHDLDRHINRSIEEIELTSHDIVLDVFPGNTIAHYVITAQLAIKVGAELHVSIFDPFRYIQQFKEVNPTFISLIPRHIELLEKTKGWKELDMSSVRYMVTGSQPVQQHMIDSLLKKGIKKVANWYGMTEMPPPVLVGYNSESFDFSPKNGYTVDFTEEGECIVNGLHTGDLFDLKNRKFIRRKDEAHNNTWKTVS